MNIKLLLSLLLSLVTYSTGTSQSNTLTAQRFTIISDYQHSLEIGTFGASGFIRQSIVTVEYGLFTTSKPEIRPINDLPVIKLGDWVLLTDLFPDITDRFSRSTETFDINGVPYIIVAWGDEVDEGGSAGDSGQTNPSGELSNISVRAQVPVNGQVIPGFVVQGQAKTVLVRASGPALAGYGVPGTLPNPKIQLFSGTNVIAENDNWSDAGNSAMIVEAAAATGAFALESGSLDAAVLVTLEPGAYTASVSGAPDTSGEILLEVYAVPQ